MIDNEYYWYGIAMVVYLTTCWMFSILRLFHTCQQPHDRRSYIWPDRKLQAVIFMIATFMLPYVLNPTNPAAWELVKSYYPTSYYFYCGVLLYMFFGSVKQWNKWKSGSWVMAILVVIALAPLVINAWLPVSFLSPRGMAIQKNIVLVVGLMTIPYCALAMWRVRKCIAEARDDNYSNYDDFPLAYAQRVWLSPLSLTPLSWPGYLTDSPKVMAYMQIPLSLFNVVLLLTVMQAWRRNKILSDSIEFDEQEESRERALIDDKLKSLAEKIEEYLKCNKAYLDPHLKMEQVVEYCGTNRTYVSRAFKEHLGGFFFYVNSLRLEHYEKYLEQHKNSTKDIAAQESGFSSYQAFYKAYQRLKAGNE